MRIVAASAALIALTVAGFCIAFGARAGAEPSLLRDDIRAVAPALERYRTGVVLGDVWKRPGLSPRDRGIATLAALIARNQTAEMADYVGIALDTGVKPAEVSEIITHLAFYAGWGNAMAAVTITRDVFAARRIAPDELTPVSPQLLPLDETREADRAKRVGDLFGAAFPGVTQYTTDVLFAICGCGPRSRRVTEAWSPSARSSRRGRSRS